MTARRSSAGAIVLALVVAACAVAATPTPQPMNELCLAMRELSAWVEAGHAVIDAAKTGDGPAMTAAADDAWVHYQNARAKNGYSGWLAGHAASVPPEWRSRNDQLGAVIADAEPTMYALANANLDVEAVGRMLNGVEVEIDQIALPAECRTPARGD